MRKTLVLLAVLILPVVLQGCRAQPSAGLSVENVYAFATAPGQKNGAVFMRIENTGSNPARLTGARGDIAERIELHTNSMDGGIMMMRKVDGHDIPAGGTLALEPAGHHIMLMGLREALSPGRRFSLNLIFENHEEKTVMVKIVQPGARP